MLRFSFNVAQSLCMPKKKRMLVYNILLMVEHFPQIFIAVRNIHHVFSWYYSGGKLIVLFINDQLKQSHLYYEIR